MIKSTQFFLFSLFLSLSFSYLFFFSPLTLFLSSYYILWLFYHFLHPRVGQALEVLSFPPLLPFLESFILSCKAARSLFRHHLHINAARGLVRQHLIRRQQYPQIFVFFLTLILYLIFSHSLCCKVCPRRYPKRLISLLATSDRSSEVTIVLGHGQILHRHSLLLFRVQLSSFPLLVVLGYSLILGLDIGPGPFLCSLYIRDQILGPAFSNAI